MPELTNTINEDIEEMISWFNGHIPLLDKAIQNIDDGTNDIPSIKTHHDNCNSIIYNLQGQPVAKPKGGVYIINGKKYVIK